MSKTSKIGWVLSMAWRDSRGSRRRLLLFISSMVLGVAALVAISSFGENLKDAVDSEAKTLLGADMSVERGAPFAPETEAIIDSLGGEQTRRISFPSMAYFPKTGGTRLTTVRAQEGAYPYYGAVESDPPEAVESYLDGDNALVDGELIEQFGVSIGDSIRIGTRSYQIAGQLLKTPRESAAMMLISPRVYIPLANLDTLLLSQGSQADYEVYFKFEEGRDVENIVETVGPTLRDQRVGFDTIAEVQEDWNEGLTNLYKFLNLVGFVALLLGGIGIASAVHVYIKQRIETVAVLRCLGAASAPTFAVYLLQATVMGLLAASFGSMVGVGIQWLLPRLLADFLPVEIEMQIKWLPIFVGICVGLGVSLLFALLPLLSVRNISPLLTLRKSVETEVGAGKVGRYIVYGLLAAAILGFSIVQAPIWQVGVAYALGIFVVFGLLALVARGITVFARRFFPSSWSYPWRQGFSNLYRPNNQTVILVLSLGLGTFLIATLFLVQQTLLNQIEVAGGDGRPNLVLYDIQPDQLTPVSEIVEEAAMPVLEQVPIVAMRLKEVNGLTVEEIKEDSTLDYSWAHRREYRSSYRDYLIESETLLEGEFTARVDEGETVVPISIEQDVAEELKVGIGDSLVWDVQGVPVETRITSVREVDWQRMQTNFFVLFPTGVLEEAPQFYVLLTRSDTDEQAGRLQSSIVESYPNVSSIDLKLILTVFDAIYSRISFVLEFMALFSILTGVIVLISAVTVSRFQRISESVLLKTLGASRAQVVKILFIEYLFLGLFAAAAGILLALASAWLLSFFVFQTTFTPPIGALLIATVLVTGLTVIVGMINSRGIYAKPPLEVLRAES